MMTIELEGCPKRRWRDAEGVERVGSGEGVYPLPSRLGGLGERRKLPQRGLERSPGRKRIWELYTQFYAISCTI
jgi:hypothetical protein